MSIEFISWLLMISVLISCGSVIGMLWIYRSLEKSFASVMDLANFLMRQLDKNMSKEE